MKWLQNLYNWLIWHGLTFKNRYASYGSAKRHFKFTEDEMQFIDMNPIECGVRQCVHQINDHEIEIVFSIRDLISYHKRLRSRRKH